MNGVKQGQAVSGDAIAGGRAKTQALKQDAQVFLQTFTLAFTTGDTAMLRTLPAQQKPLRERHQREGQTKRFEFDLASGQVIETHIPEILRQAAGMGIINPLLNVVNRTNTEHSTRDFTTESLVRGLPRLMDVDSKLTFGWHIVLEITTGSKQGWLIRMRDGQYILSSRVGPDGFEMLLIPVDGLRQIEPNGETWYMNHAEFNRHDTKISSDGKGGTIVNVQSWNVKTKLKPVNLTPAWEAWVKASLINP